MMSSWQAPLRAIRSTLTCVAIVCPIGFASAESAPTRVYDAPATAAKRAISLLGAVDSTPALAVTLPPLSAGEKAELQSLNMGKVRHVGLGRSLPKHAQAIALDELAWIPAADGGRFATVELRSTGAAAVRVGLAPHSIAKGLTIAAYGVAMPELVYPAAYELAGADEISWLPAVEGEVVRLELRAERDAQLSGRALEIPLLSHLVASIRGGADKNLGDIGRAGTCNIDIACRPTRVQGARSTVKYYLTNPNGTTGLCTGTLMNTSGATTTPPPYFLTANHCFETQSIASSLHLYWFFERAACNTTNPTTITETTGGGALLFTSPANDATFVRLNQAPPAGAGYSGWSTGALTAGAEIFGVHHPSGDLKKYSRGAALNFTEYGAQNGDANSTHVRVQWSEGTTEGGSSGSGLFNTNGQLVGTLHGGQASCTALTSPDWYGRFDQQFASLAQWLAPNEPPPAPPPPPPPPPPPSSQVTDLTSGSGVNGSVTFNGSVWYRIQATSSHSKLAVQLSNLTADADLYVLRDAQTGTPVCQSRNFNTTPDSCEVDLTGAATWYIQVYGYEAANYSLLATLTGTAAPPPPPPAPTPTPPPSGGGGGGGGGGQIDWTLLLLLLAPALARSTRRGARHV